MCSLSREENNEALCLCACICELHQAAKDCALSVLLYLTFFLFFQIYIILL